MATRRIVFACIATLLLSAAQVQAQTVIGSDDFDGGGVFTSRTFDPDLSGNLLPGTWTSNFDVFGIVDPFVNFRFMDDTLTDPTFTGIFQSGDTDFFFGVMDTVNDENPDGFVTLTYEFDITGATNLMFSADFAAYGDFEDSDIFQITASIDGGAATTILEFLPELDIDDYEYVFESGATSLMNDPMAINGTIVDNNVATFSAPIAGSGSTLTIVITVETNGGSESMAMDDLEITGTTGGTGGDFVPPAAVNVFRGVLLSGALADYQDSDDALALFNPGFTINNLEAPVWLIFDAVAASATSFRVESSAGTPGLTYTVEAFNWANGMFEEIGVMDETFNNETVETFNIVAADHIDAGGEVRGRVGWRQTSFTINFPWEIRVDQAGWNQ